MEQPACPRNSICFQHSAQKLCTSATIVPHPAQRGGSAKSSTHRAQVRNTAVARVANIGILSRGRAHRTSVAVSQLFDIELRAFRRDRAARIGPELFLFERAFADCLERLALVQRRFARGLLIGCPDQSWPTRLREFLGDVEVCDPGPLFAEAAGGQTIVEDEWTHSPAHYDLVLAIGTLDTVNDLPRTLKSIFLAMRPASLFLGAASGGDTLPELRSAIRAADAVTGVASPHVHPRIEASAVAPLLSQAGFLMPVVDVDRPRVS